MVRADRIDGLGKSNEVARDQFGSLVDQLIERVLTVCSRFAPVNWASLVRHFLPFARDTFTVALHRQLLEIRWKSFQVLLIRQNRNRLRPKKVVVPDRQETHEDREIAVERRGAEMLVHLV